MNTKAKNESKAQRVAGVVNRMAEKAGITAAAPTTPAPKAPTQENKNPENKTTEPKTKKKISAGVAAWRAINEGKPFGEDQRLTVTVDKNPKHKEAAARFAQYAGCKTVGDYVSKVTNPAANTSVKVSKAQGHQDVRWDVAHGWVKIG